jgi:hypothetical protein
VDRRGTKRVPTPSDRLLQIFDVLPGLYTEEDLLPLMAGSNAPVGQLLGELSAENVLRRETIGGTAAYWKPDHGFDPRRGVLRTLGLLPLEFPLDRAARRARSELERKVLMYQEDLGAHGFSYLPLWRVPAKVPGKGQDLVRDFYVHGGKGTLGFFIGGRFAFHDIVPRPAWKLPPAVWPADIERVPAGDVRGEVLPVKVAPKEAVETVGRKMGMRPDPEGVELCLLPLWRFEVVHRIETHRRPRHLWVDGTFGSVSNEPP